MGVEPGEVGVVGAAEEVDVFVGFAGEKFFVCEDGAVFCVGEDEMEVWVFCEELLVGGGEAADVFVRGMFADVEDEIFEFEVGVFGFYVCDVGGFVGDGDFFGGDLGELDEFVFCEFCGGDNLGGFFGGAFEGELAELLFGFEVEPVFVVVVGFDEGEVVEGGDGAAFVEDGLLGHAKVDEVGAVVI